MAFKTTGKRGSRCPFNDNLVCGDDCGFFTKGLQSCVLHAINLNLGSIDKRLMALSMNTDKLINNKEDKK